MFEYNGDRYTEQEVRDAASAAGLDFNSYIDKYGVVKEEINDGTTGKTNAAAGETANVVAEPIDTELQSEPVSLATLTTPSVNDVFKEEVALAETKTTGETVDWSGGEDYTQEQYEQKLEEAKKNYAKATYVDEQKILENSKKELLEEFKLASETKVVGGGYDSGPAVYYKPADSFVGDKKAMYEQYTSTGNFDLTYEASAEAIENEINPREQEFARGLPGIIRSGLTTEFSLEKNEIDGKKAVVEEKFYATMSALEENLAKNEEGYDFSIQEVEENKNLVALAGKQRNQLLSLIDKTNNADDAVDLFRRSYSKLDLLGSAFKTVGLNTALGVTELGDMMAENKDYQSEATKYLIELNRDHKDYIKNDLAKPIEAKNIQNVSQLGYWAADTFVNQTPYLLALASGNATPYVFGALGTTARLAEFSMEEDKARKTVEFLTEQIDLLSNVEDEALKAELEEAKNVLGKNDAVKFATSVAHGLGEMIDGYADRFLLGGATKAWKHIPIDGFKNQVAKSVKSIPKGIGVEVASENITLGIQNAADILLDKQDKSWTEGGTETTAAAILMGSGFKVVETAGTARGAILNSIASREEKAAINDQLKKINNYESIIKNPKSSESSKKEAKKERNKTIKEVNRLQDVTSARLLKLNKNDQFEVLDLDRKARAIKRKWESIASDYSLSDSQKETYRIGLLEEFDNYQNKKRSLLQKASPQNLVKKNKVDDFSVGDYIRRADNTNVQTQQIKVHNSNSKFANKIFDITESEFEAIEQHVASESTESIKIDGTEMTAQEAKSFVDNSKNKDGLYDPNLNFIALMPWKSNFATEGVALHEYTHAALNHFGIPKSEFARIEQDLINTLDDSGLTESQLKKVRDKLKAYENKSSEERGEEIFAVIGDAVNNEILNKYQNADFFDKLGIRIRNLLAKRLSPETIKGLGISDAKGAVDFVKKFQSDALLGAKVKKGNLVNVVIDDERGKVLASEIAEKVKFEDDSINERFKAFTYDGKNNNAPSSFHAEAAYQYQPLAEGVVKGLASGGLAKGSPEQNNLIMKYLENETNKQELVEQLVMPVGGDQASSLLGLAKSFDPGIGSFGGYAKGFLAARAIRQLKNKMQGSFIGSQEIDSPESKQVASNDIEVGDIDTRSTSEKLGFDNAIKNEATSIAAQATQKASNELSGKDLSNKKKANLKKKSFDKLVENRIMPLVKKAIGKNTKTNKAFTDFVSKNFEPLRDIFLDQIDVQKGSGPASLWSINNPPFLEEFLDYYEGSGTTKSDRRSSLARAVSRSIANEARIEFAKKDPATAELFEKEHGVVLGSEITNVPKGAPRQIDRSIAKILKSADVAKINYLQSTNDIDKLFTKLTPLFLELPIDIISKTLYRPSGLRLFGNVYKGRKGKDKLLYDELNAYYDKKRDESIRYIEENSKNKFYGDAVNFNTSFSLDSLGQTDVDFDANVANGNIAKNNLTNLAAHKQIWQPLYELIVSDKSNASIASWFLGNASYGAVNWHRLGAEVVGRSDSDGSGYTYEHAMPSSASIAFLVESAIKKVPFSTAYSAMSRNFKVIALNKSDDKKVNGAGYKQKMPKGWDVYTSSWTERYFNPSVLFIDGGINPTGLKDLNGQTLADKYKIDAAGHSNAVLGSEIINEDFNKMLERVKGVKAEARYSEDRANKLAGNKGKFKFFVPYSAEDFVGLIYPTLGKGKEGDRNMQWYKETLLDPFAIGISNFEKAKQVAMNDWAELKKKIKNTPAGLKKEAVRGFTNEEAVRVYLWNENGVVPETLAKKDVTFMVKHVRDNKVLKDFAEGVKSVLGGRYPDPQGDWLAGTLTTDLINDVNTVGRKEFLQQWQENVDIVYSKENMNKLKAIYGERYTEALDNILHRMKTGRNRPGNKTRLENSWMDWVNDSVGTVMFFNTRSALLQTISSINFLNWSDNNPLMAGKAFTNQPQFWKDFSLLFNSDFLKQRRSGLKNDVNADEIANAAATSTNKVKAAMSALLQAGFLPTQIADSFAISIGGASFYRNRLNTYIKDGLSEQEASEKAMLDFQETAEESQQSSRPDRVSMQQAGSLGRVILAFANTPMQYTRLTKKAALDLANGRGDWKTNMSKILYYGAVQNIVFTALQQAMFAMAFDDDTEDDEKEASAKIVNGIADTFLRGSGVGGAAVATIKNIILEAIKQQKSKRTDYTKAALKATTLSPPIDTKIRKLMSAGRAFTYKQSLKDMRSMGIDVDNPAGLAVGQMLSAAANIPVDRAILKARNIKGALDTENEAWQQIALALGYSEWQLGIDKDNSKSFPKGISLEKGRLEKGRSLEKGRDLEKGRSLSPAKKLAKGEAGQAHRDGTIEIDPDLSPIEREKTIVHEKQHIKDMNAGRLDYDDNYVYWNGKKYERKNGKIKYNGKWYIEGHKSLPWEKKAYDAEPTTQEIKKRKKLY